MDGFDGKEVFECIDFVDMKPLGPGCLVDEMIVSLIVAMKECLKSLFVESKSIIGPCVVSKDLASISCFDVLIEVFDDEESEYGCLVLILST